MAYLWKIAAWIMHNLNLHGKTLADQRWRWELIANFAKWDGDLIIMYIIQSLRYCITGTKLSHRLPTNQDNLSLSSTK